MLWSNQNEANWRVGLAPASRVLGYIMLVAGIMTNAEHLFGQDQKPYLAAVTMLTLFSTSVLVCATLVLGKPYLLWVEKKPKQALELVAGTAKWLLFFVLIVLGIVAWW